MLPPQLPKIYLAGSQRVDDLLSQINATIRDGFRVFWQDPIGQAVPMNLQSRAAGMTAKGVFDMHGQLITALAGIVPDRLAWYGTGPPIDTPFTDAGDIDIPALTTAWTAHLATLPQPEPQEEPVEP